MCNYYTKLFGRRFSGTFSERSRKNQSKMKTCCNIKCKILRVFGKSGFFLKNDRNLTSKNKARIAPILVLCGRLSLEQFGVQNHLTCGIDIVWIFEHFEEQFCGCFTQVGSRLCYRTQGWI